MKRRIKLILKKREKKVIWLACRLYIRPMGKQRSFLPRKQESTYKTLNPIMALLIQL